MNIGTIIQWGSNTIPDNWLLCDGSAVSRTTYAELFAVIGTNFGSGDGSTTFNLPDLRGRVPVGKSSETEFDTIGKNGGSKELQEHYHSIDYYVGQNLPGGVDHFLVYGTNSLPVQNTLGTKKAGTGDSGNLQPYVVTNYIIKATQPDTIKISELESATSVTSNDVLPIVQNGETKKVTTNVLLRNVNLGITEILNEIDTLQGDLLWENENSQADFTEQTISLDLIDYDYVEIWYRSTSGGGIASLKIKKNTGQARMLSFKYLSGTYGGDCLLTRGASVTNTGIIFTMAHALGVAQNSTSTQHDGCIIPAYIYGYKEIVKN